MSIIDHYLNNFVMLSRPKSTECVDNFKRMMETCRDIGMPVETEKSEDPTTKLVFLGIEIDSAWEMGLPADTLAKMKDSVTAWRGKKKACRKKRPITDRHVGPCMQGHKARLLISTSTY